MRLRSCIMSSFQNSLQSNFKIGVIFILFFTFLSCSFKKSLVGLYSECNSPNWGYMCQQVSFETDSTFKFYDLLHLRGWTVSEGYWTRKGDTIILNSKRKPYDLIYLDRSGDDSIKVVFKSRNGNDLYCSIRSSTGVITSINPPYQYFWFNKVGLDTIIIHCITDFRAKIALDRDKIITSKTVKVVIDESTAHQIFFKNEKWLKRGKKLFHTQNPDGSFDKDKYFLKTNLTELKYEEKEKNHR